MSERKKVSNVAVRVPSSLRDQLTDGGRLPLTSVVERILAGKAAELAELPIRGAPVTAERTFLSLRSDLSDQLRQVARRRSTTVSTLLYSLIESTMTGAPVAQDSGARVPGASVPGRRSRASTAELPASFAA